jgi:hypothetical protein
MGFEPRERSGHLADRYIAFSRGCRQRAELGDANEQGDVFESQTHPEILAGLSKIAMPCCARSRFVGLVDRIWLIPSLSYLKDRQ